MNILQYNKQTHFYKNLIANINRKQCLLDFICLAALKAADVGAPSALFRCNTRTT